MAEQSVFLLWRYLTIDKQFLCYADTVSFIFLSNIQFYIIQFIKAWWWKKMPVNWVIVDSIIVCYPFSTKSLPNQVYFDPDLSEILIKIQKQTGGRLNKKDGLTRYGNSHVKDKTS